MDVGYMTSFKLWSIKFIKYYAMMLYKDLLCTMHGFIRISDPGIRYTDTVISDTSVQCFFDATGLPCF